jgi:hypothetical protein
MAAVRMKPQYGPTLGVLLSPRWRAASPLVRAIVIAACVALLALLIGAGLTLENASYSHGGPVPFSFSYRNLYRVKPDPGGFVKMQRHRSDGELEDSLAVGPLRLPPYSGTLSGELPLYAAGYITGLRRRHPQFELAGEGKTKVDTIFAYAVSYTTVLDGRTMWGRDILLLPERPGAREGVDIVMLTSPTADSQVDGPQEVGSAGVLSRPLRTFSFD